MTKSVTHDQCDSISPFIYTTFTNQRQIRFIPLADERGVGKSVRSLRTRAVTYLSAWQSVFTTRRYTNPRLPLPVPNHTAWWQS